MKYCVPCTITDLKQTSHVCKGLSGKEREPLKDILALRMKSFDLSSCLGLEQTCTLANRSTVTVFCQTVLD